MILSFSIDVQKMYYFNILYITNNQNKIKKDRRESGIKLMLY
jgi:hypothetical protein